MSNPDKKSVKNVLITGATRGLGLAYAQNLAKHGYNIALTDISKDACRVYDKNSLDDILTKLRSFDCKANFYPADLTDMASTQKMVNDCIKEYGTIDGVITSAGGDISGSDSSAAGGKAENNTFFISYEEHENIFKRNYYTCLHTLRAIVPHMVENKFGKIITVSSVNAGFGVPKETTYSVAKCAVMQLTRSLAAELRPQGINVNCLMPGPITTGRFLATVKNRNPHDLVNLESDARLERVGKPEDVVGVAEFLLANASDFISGQVIRVDGGLFTSPV